MPDLSPDLAAARELLHAQRVVFVDAITEHASLNEADIDPEDLLRCTVVATWRPMRYTPIGEHIVCDAVGVLAATPKGHPWVRIAYSRCGVVFHPDCDLDIVTMRGRLVLLCMHADKHRHIPVTALLNADFAAALDVFDFRLVADKE
jgi:hypothetical protein